MSLNVYYRIDAEQIRANPSKSNKIEGIKVWNINNSCDSSHFMETNVIDFDEDDGNNGINDTDDRQTKMKHISDKGNISIRFKHFLDKSEAV